MTIRVLGISAYYHDSAAALGVLFVPFGVSFEKAVAAGLIFQAIIISGNLFGGLIAALIGHFAPFGAADRIGVLVRKSAHQQGVLGALVLGGILFFAGSLVGFVYGAAPGYLAGRLLGRPR